MFSQEAKTKAFELMTAFEGKKIIVSRYARDKPRRRETGEK